MLNQLDFSTITWPQLTYKLYNFKNPNHTNEGSTEQQIVQYNNNMNKILQSYITHSKQTGKCTGSLLQQNINKVLQIIIHVRGAIGPWPLDGWVHRSMCPIHGQLVLHGYLCSLTPSICSHSCIYNHTFLSPCCETTCQATKHSKLRYLLFRSYADVLWQ